jgi:HEPN domain-containing protein
VGKKWYKKAAFMLHQATELFYKTVILVFTNYRPKGHYLDTFGSMCAGFDPRFLTVFPQQSENEKKCFELLNDAYVDARYKKTYKITKRQLEYLAKRVQKLQRLTNEVCKERIDSFLRTPEK